SPRSLRTTSRAGAEHSARSTLVGVLTATRRTGPGQGEVFVPQSASLGTADGTRVTPYQPPVEPVRVKTHAAPKPDHGHVGRVSLPSCPLSPGPPTSAVRPLAESARLAPNAPSTLSSLGLSPSPCWVQAAPECVKTHAVPLPWLLLPSPISAVLPLAESATGGPMKPFLRALRGLSASPCCVHAAPERVKAHAAGPSWSLIPPTSAAPPCPEIATLEPNLPPRLAKLGLSSSPCWVHVPPERVNAQAVPKPKPLLCGAPISAVLPLAESATLQPKEKLGSSLGLAIAPCSVHAPPERVKTHAAPGRWASVGPPISPVLPSAESATLQPKLTGKPMGVSLGLKITACSVHAPPERVKTHAAPRKLW